VRQVRGRRGQIYLLCRNDAIPAKYPRQPVAACPGYRHNAASPGTPPLASEPPP